MMTTNHEIISLRPLIKAPVLKLKPLKPRLECGFPLPYEGEQMFRQAIDLGKELVTNWVTTFVATAWNDSMEPLIHTGDILLIDRSLPIKNGCYLAGVINGGWFMKRYWKEGDQIILYSENEIYSPIVVEEHMNYREFGRIYKVIQSL
jgi:DNA polymerase V